MDNDTSDQENENPLTPDSDKPDKQTKTHKPSLVNTLLLILVIVLAGALAYLYNIKSEEISNLETELSQLKQATTKTTDEVKLDEATPVEEATASCSGDSSYTASTGKFTATLSSPYVIIRNLDGDFEGGPVTSLDIASCATGEVNVYDNPLGSEVKILAHPASSSSELRSSYEANNGTLSSNGTMTIDGVTANRYTLSALFETTVIYFDNAGIGYQIELTDTNTFTTGILTDLTADWTFNP